ncbi:MAG: hypothetical protein AVDCRST_MAG85-2085 [uncultured Solirubrobacteraceae bacterium]|uniref:Uncharacterized protein n=1 Tax=uncultured Solirubrobacteraceae bacterium TaxID=1162706 RepID=A0A6J4SVQ9_9ACTN|nr:MAG: hypothetical protein AVDCRST_MAG85-2085 [uncultured Solirubrobacteraceae bacterium]
MRPPGFAVALGLIALVGLAVRVAYALLTKDWQELQGDALSYHLTGQYLADGEGWRRPEVDLPTAEFPPAQSTLLGAATLFGLGGVFEQKLLLCVVGAVTVALIGLVGRAAAGSERVGLIAAAIAALYPPLWVMSGTLLGETLYGLLLVSSLLAAYAAWREATTRRFAVLGALIALAALARGEALGLVVLVLLPLAWRARRRAALPLAVAGVAAFALVLTPWTVRNLATFEKPVLISNNANGVWVGANCERTYFTEEIGSWRFDCYGERPEGDESEQFSEYRRRGMEYLRDHLGRWPRVVAARVGRLYDVYRPWDQGVFFAGIEGRHPRATKMALLAYWTLIPFAIAGAVLLRRRARPLLILLAPIALVSLVAIATYGVTRFRFAAEPSFVVLGAVAVDALLSRVRR